MKIQIKLLNSMSSLPSHGSAEAAGYDLRACRSGREGDYVGDPYDIGPGETVQIPTGYFGAIFARSGLATKQGLRPATCVGVIDSDYRGEIYVPLHNDSQEHRRVADGDRIGQIIIMKHSEIEFEEVDDLTVTERGTNGFGSTGKD